MFASIRTRMVVFLLIADIHFRLVIPEAVEYLQFSIDVIQLLWPQKLQFKIISLDHLKEWLEEIRIYLYSDWFTLTMHDGYDYENKNSGDWCLPFKTFNPWEEIRRFEMPLYSFDFSAA